MFGGMIMAFENSAVHDMILEYLARLPQDHTPVKAGILERSVMRAIAPKKLFPNPDDEFTDPKIGPNDSIIMNYSQIARWNRARDLDVYRNKQKIVYTVEEKKSPVITGKDDIGTYAYAVSGDAQTGFTVTNTHTPKKYTITYKLNGGSYAGSKADIKEVYYAGTEISIHEKPVRSGYTFLYWKGSQYQPGDSYTVTEDHTFTAQWEKDGPDPDDPSDPPQKGTPPTGDSTPVAGWLMMMLLAAGVMLLLERRRRTGR